MTDKAQNVIADAQRIALRDGFADIKGWAVAKAPWRDIGSTAQAGMLAAYPEDANPEQKTVLEALRFQGSLEAYEGYHRRDYVAGPELRQMIETYHRQVRKQKRDETRNLAHRELYYSDHRSMLEYAAAELDWQKTTQTPQGGFVLKHEDLNTDQKPLVETLMHAGVVAKGFGYHQNDYIAAGVLAEVLQAMTANVEASRTFASRVGSLPATGSRNL